MPIYLRFVVVCDILGSQKFCKYLERVAIQKSLRTPDVTDYFLTVALALILVTQFEELLKS